MTSGDNLFSNFSSDEYNLSAEEETDVENQRILLHVDIDYFFAQVEIQKQPELKGKPIIVGHTKARETGRGVVLTCSYEAREFGVHSGLAMKLALDRCPDAIIVKSEYNDYREISNKIMEILRDLEVPMRQAGIDEAYLDITTLVDNFVEAHELAIKIKEEIFERVALTVSIGIGPTLKIAKIGSDYKKPNGITVITPERVEEIFNGLPLIKIPGIGKKTAVKLEKRNLHTCDQLLRLSLGELTDMLGTQGQYYYNILHAKTANKIKPRGVRKSISHSRTFIGDPGDIKTSIEYLDKLFNSSYKTLIEENFKTKTVGLRIRFNGFDTITRAQSLPFYSTDRETLYNIAKKVIEPYLEDPRGIRLLGVGFYNLQKMEENQLSLTEFTEIAEPNDFVKPVQIFAAEKHRASLDDFFD